VGVAVVALGTEVILAATLPPSYPPQPHGLAALLGCFAGAAPVALRRIAPRLATAGLLVLTAVPLLLHQPLLAQGLTVACLGYTSAARFAPRWAVLVSLVLWVPGLVLNRLDRDLPVLYQMTGGNLLLSLVVFFVGRTAFNRRAYAAELAEGGRIAAVSQRALTEHAVADERRRIARELHDVVALLVSVRGVLATGARRALARQPGATDEALATIEATGRTALREMRRLLDVLRTEEDPLTDLDPQPDLAQVGHLVEQVREAGLPVTVRIEGHTGPLDPGVALTAYRIVQEALTNVLKHAGTAAAEVSIVVDGHALTIDVVDTGHGPPTGTRRIGHGLLGMRERVALYGGTLRTGTRAGGGFRLTATIPLDERPPAKIQISEGKL
jgi:signal transduction histidine kinase